MANRELSLKTLDLLNEFQAIPKDKIDAALPRVLGEINSLEKAYPEVWPNYFEAIRKMALEIVRDIKSD